MGIRCSSLTRIDTARRKELERRMPEHEQPEGQHEPEQAVGRQLSDGRPGQQRERDDHPQQDRVGGVQSPGRVARLLRTPTTITPTLKSGEHVAEQAAFEQDPAGLDFGQREGAGAAGAHIVRQVGAQADARSRSSVKSSNATGSPMKMVKMRPQKSSTSDASSKRCCVIVDRAAGRHSSRSGEQQDPGDHDRDQRPGPCPAARREHEPADEVGDHHQAGQDDGGARAAHQCSRPRSRRTAPPRTASGGRCACARRRPRAPAARTRARKVV